MSHRAAAVAWLAAGLLLAPGCAKTPLRDRFDEIEKQLSRAEDAGAYEYARRDLEGARRTYEFAEVSESEALSGREDAEEARKEAMEGVGMIEKAIADRQASLAEAEGRYQTARMNLERLRRRGVELGARGLTQEEIDRAIGQDLVIGELTVGQERAAIETTKAEIQLLELQAAEARIRISEAGTRMQMSGQQLLHAKALAERALVAAQMAEAKAIALRKAELDKLRAH